MKNLIRTFAVIVVLVVSAAYAGTPPVTTQTVIPGLTPDSNTRILTAAFNLAQNVFNNYGEKVGYPLGSKLDETDTNCMVYIGIMGALNEHEALLQAKPGSAVANGINKAKNWAQRGIDDWCRPRGGMMNRGMTMFGMAVTDVNKDNASKDRFEEGWLDRLKAFGAKIQRNEPLTPKETLFLGVVVGAFLIKEAIPVLP